MIFENKEFKVEELFYKHFETLEKIKNEFQRFLNDYLKSKKDIDETFAGIDYFLLNCQQKKLIRSFDLNITKDFVKQELSYTSVSDFIISSVENQIGADKDLLDWAIDEGKTLKQLTEQSKNRLNQIENRLNQI